MSGTANEITFYIETQRVCRL